MTGLFDSMSIKNVKMKNRIAVPPMVCFNWSDDSGMVTDRHVAHYGAIAEGGAGLIIQEATCIEKKGRLSFDQLGIWSDEQIPGLKRITDAVHKAGCPVFIQLHHAGVTGAEKETVAPSEYTFSNSRRTNHGRELSVDEIHTIQNQFVEAAERAWKAGYDGIELHGCHGYLMSQFFNRDINKREDIYGTKPETFAAQVFSMIRRKLPPDFVVGIRLGGFEPDLASGIEHAKQMEQCGADFLDISYGFTQRENQSPEDYPFADIIYAAQEIKKSVHIPVFAVQDIDSAEKAQNVLNTAKVDMVDVGRGVLVNYNWANDAASGRDVGRCLHCSVCQWRIDPERCAGRLLMKKHSSGYQKK